MKCFLYFFFCIFFYISFIFIFQPNITYNITSDEDKEAIDVFKGTNVSNIRTEAKKLHLTKTQKRRIWDRINAGNFDQTVILWISSLKFFITTASFFCFWFWYSMYWYILIYCDFIAFENFFKERGWNWVDVVKHLSQTRDS